MASGQTEKHLKFLVIGDTGVGMLMFALSSVLLLCTSNCRQGKQCSIAFLRNLQPLFPDLYNQEIH